MQRVCCNIHDVFNSLVTRNKPTQKLLCDDLIIIVNFKCKKLWESLVKLKRIPLPSFVVRHYMTNL